MNIPRSTIPAAIFFAALAFGAPAKAADAAHAWGTVSNPGGELVNSLQAHELGGVSANMLAAGPGGGSTTGGGPAVTSCGSCTYITIQGNNDTISGNTITSTNTGTVTSTGTFQ